MTEDTRRFRSSEEMANALFGSAIPSLEERKLREEQHKAAQALPPIEPEVRRKGWLPSGVTTSAIGAFAFRDMRPATEAELERMKRDQMREVVRDARGRR